MSALFAVPGGPISTACSPATTAIEQQPDDLVFAEKLRVEGLRNPPQAAGEVRGHRRFVSAAAVAWKTPLTGCAQRPAAAATIGTARTGIASRIRRRRFPALPALQSASALHAQSPCWHAKPAGQAVAAGAAVGRSVSRLLHRRERATGLLRGAGGCRRCTGSADVALSLAGLSGTAFGGFAHAGSIGRITRRVARAPADSALLVAGCTRNSRHAVEAARCALRGAVVAAATAVAHRRSRSCSQPSACPVVTVAETAGAASDRARTVTADRQRVRARASIAARRGAAGCRVIARNTGPGTELLARGAAAGPGASRAASGPALPSVPAAPLLPRAAGTRHAEAPRIARSAGAAEGSADCTRAAELPALPPLPPSPGRSGRRELVVVVRAPESDQQAREAARRAFDADIRTDPRRTPRRA